MERPNTHDPQEGLLKDRFLPERLTATQLSHMIQEVVQTENKKLLDKHTALKPLLSPLDVARALSVSKRTVETMVAAEELPAPLWVKGQRRWHPDVIVAYMRSTSRTGKIRRVS